GCGLCVAACKTENGVTDDPECNRTWVERHVVGEDGTVHVESPDGGIHGFDGEAESASAAPGGSVASGASAAPGGSVASGASAAPGGSVASGASAAYFVPRLCMQCEESPCTTVCPVGATYRTPDGVILVDEARCIGCGYCVTACPYGARYIVPAAEGAARGTPGVADKCTWCYHRLARGLEPACVEVCPVGARRLGDRNDPTSQVARLIAEHDPQPLWPEYGTLPRVLYLGPILEEA
ncbi:MAG TPA: 4Fe-4S dicluster domain-containing protein, partial [Candidatus Limnocylindrales bacterium]|nr:4Fe-4S dicluster domain-containing protein [Candidatus Limnocylindrales bacterium]